MPENTDMSALPHFRQRDRNHLPPVEPSIMGIREALICDITPIRAGGMKYYAPIGPADDGTPRGGVLQLSQAQVRHLAKQLTAMVEQWDTEPRDLAAEADMILWDRGYLGRNRASRGYEIETDGTSVYVYFSDGREHINGPFEQYAHALATAGYTGPDGIGRPVIEDGTDEHAPRVRAIPPAAESF